MDDEKKVKEEEQTEEKEEVCTPKMSHFQRAEARVYATGNRWAIENWHATHY